MSEEHSFIPITEVLLDKVVNLPAHQGWSDAGALVYYSTVAVPATAVAAVGGFAADEIDHYVVTPVTAVTDALADDDVALLGGALSDAMGHAGDASASTGAQQDESIYHPGSANDGGMTDGRFNMEQDVAQQGGQFNMEEDAAAHENQVNMSQDAVRASQSSQDDSSVDDSGYTYDDSWGT